MNYNESITVRSEFACAYLTALDISYEDMKIDPHRYRFEATVSKKLDMFCSDSGPCCRILDFEKIHKILNNILPKDTYLYCKWSDKVDKTIGDILSEHNCSVIGIPDIICAESICNYISQNLENRFLQLSKIDSDYRNVHLIHSVLREDSNNYVTWDPQD